MSKKSFEEIVEKVKGTLEPLQNVSHDYLNERGKLVYKVYDILDECFGFAGNLEELVEEIRLNIEELSKPCWYRSPDVADSNKEIAEKLRRFVRWNISNELWESIPEFQNRKEN